LFASPRLAPESGEFWEIGAQTAAVDGSRAVRPEAGMGRNEEVRKELLARGIFTEVAQKHLYREVGPLRHDDRHRPG
jgi:hypothetical protein